MLLLDLLMEEIVVWLIPQLVHGLHDILQDSLRGGKGCGQSRGVWQE